MALNDLPTEGHVNLPEEAHHAIQTIPGGGPKVAVYIIGEIGNAHRFSNVRELVAFSGLGATEW